MKKILLLSVLLSSFAFTQDLEVKNLNISLNYWVSDCVKEADSFICEVNKAVEGTKQENIVIELILPEKEGQFSRKQIDLAEYFPVKGRLSLSSKKPVIGSKVPPYMTTSFELFSPVNVLCQSHEKWEENLWAAPLICASYIEVGEKKYKRYGFTIQIKESM